MASLSFIKGHHHLVALSTQRNQKLTKSTSQIPLILRFVSTQPPPAHLDCATPLLEHLIAFFFADVGLEDHAVLLVDLLELVKLLPDVDGEAGGDRGA